MKRVYIYAFIALLALGLLIVGDRYFLHMATMVCLMIPLALAMYLTVKMGQLSLAQAAFMGLGAYSAALFAMRLGLPPLIGVILGGIIPALFAAVLGPIFLRIKGVFFVLLTFAFAQIVNLVFQEWTALFGGNGGLYGIPKFNIFGYRISGPAQFYVLSLAFAVVTYIVTKRIDTSDIGKIVDSLNKDEMLSQSLGLNVQMWRLAIFVFGAFMTGIAGGLYAFYIGFLSPDAFGFRTIIDLIVMIVIGGSGAALGPVLGALVIVPLPELLREAREYQLLAYGLSLALILLFQPRGIMAMLGIRQKDK